MGDLSSWTIRQIVGPFIMFLLQTLINLYPLRFLGLSKSTLDISYCMQNLAVDYWICYWRSFKVWINNDGMIFRNHKALLPEN